MSELDTPGRAEGAFGRVLRWLALTAGWILLGLLFYTILDVVLRYVFNSPFRGSLEFTQFLMSAIVFLGLAYCGWTGGHIAVDIFERTLSRPGIRYIPAFLTLISAVLFAVIAYYMLLDGIDTKDRISNMLRWPYYPFIFISVFGSAVYALVLLVQAIAAFRGPASNDTKAPHS